MADDDGASPSGIGDIRNLLGFLVAGFAGALNLIGLNSGEIDVVLRNDPLAVSVIAALLLTGVLAAVVSVFIKASSPVGPAIALTLLILTASLFFLMIWWIPLVPSTAASGHPEHNAGMLVTIALWVLAAICLLTGGVIGGVRKLGERDDEDHPVTPARHRLADLLNVQFVLLSVAILLTSTAAYGALRLESASQAEAVAELGDSLQVNAQYDILSVSVSASKLSTTDWLSVVASAIPRGQNWRIATMCASRISKKVRKETGLRCDGDPCYYFALNHRHCPRISVSVISPDSSGGVQQTLQVPFSPSAYQHLQIIGTTCAPSPSVQGECYATGSPTRLDIAIPQPPKSS